MENQKSKIHEILKKLCNQSLKLQKSHPQEKFNINTLALTKKSTPNSPLKSKRNHFNYANQKQSSAIKKYTFNKTSYGTPYQLSTMISSLSTPNQNQQIKNKLKKYQSNRNIFNQHPQMYQQHLNQNIAEQFIMIQFFIAKKKIGSKVFYSFQNISHIKKQIISLIKKDNYQLNNCYGMIGLDPIPYNHGLRLALNNKNTTISMLINKNIKTLSIQPILVSEKPSFQNIQLKHFQLLKHLGSGGFSTVYLAKCEIDQRVCALKFIKKNSITSAKKAKMLQNQKQILFTIDSVHLVDLLYAFQSNNYIIFGLEYCENGNLYHFLQKHKKIPECDVRYIFKEILQGLQYLHANNILFRDLKLENILFDQNGKLKITDFGLSKPEVSEQDITYSYCGSPEYMAPQMLAKCGHSFKVDYYALGILLYELLYGISPFYAPKKQDIFMAIMNSQPKFPRQPQVSKQVKDLIKGLLAKDPDHRIGSLKGVQQIKNHPWLRNIQHQKTETLKFIFQNLKISSRQIKQIKQNLKIDLSDHNYKKCFFPKSFVNKKIIDQIVNNIVLFGSKKDKCDKIGKSSSRNRTHNK